MYKVFGIDPSITGTAIANDQDQIVINTKPFDGQTMTQNLQRRCQEIIARLGLFINQHTTPGEEIVLSIEYPMPNAKEANFLLEAGWLLAEIYNRLPLFTQAKIVSILEFPPSTLKRLGTGVGDAPKKHKDDQCGTVKKLKKGNKHILCVACLIKKKFKKEFENDKGVDKAHAWLAYKVGIGVVNGEIEYNPIARRGQGGKVKVDGGRSRAKSVNRTATSKVRKKTNGISRNRSIRARAKR